MSSVSKRFSSNKYNLKESQKDSPIMEVQNEAENLDNDNQRMNTNISLNRKNSGKITESKGKILKQPSFGNPHDVAEHAEHGGDGKIKNKSHLKLNSQIMSKMKA